MKQDDALLALLQYLDAAAYDFVTPTPATHARFVARSDMARDLRDVLGWSLPFRRETINPAAFDLLDRAGVLEQCEGTWRSTIRVSRCASKLFIHSRYPTVEDDAVFFGPDSYRFVRFIRASIAHTTSTSRTVDIGCGSGVGGIIAAGMLPQAEVLLLDINPSALRFAELNARHAGLDAELRLGGVAEMPDGPDLVLANPPYILDPSGPRYRNGGNMHGAEMSLDWTTVVLPRLAAGGRLLLYTGSAIVGGEDRLKAALAVQAREHGCAFDYEEIDPDVFGEQLSHPGYEQVERIAAIGAIFSRPS